MDRTGRILMERNPIRTLSEWSDVEPGFYGGGYGRLEKLYHSLNPAELKRKIETIKERLVRLARRKKHTNPLSNNSKNNPREHLKMMQYTPLGWAFE